MENIESTEQTAEQSEQGQSFLPDEYKNDKSFESYKDLSSILKTYKEQEKANSRAIAFVPNESSTQEQWDKFYTKIGRPANEDEYSVPESKLPEGYQRDEEFIKNARAMAHKVGLRPEQFNALFNTLEQANIEHYNKQLERDKEFDSLLDKHIGENKESVLQEVSGIISKYLPEELKPALSKLDNQGLVAMAIAIKGIKKDYMDSDTISTTGSTVSNVEDKKAEYFKIREQMSKLDSFSSEYQQLLSKKVQLAGQIGKTVVEPF